MRALMGVTLIVLGSIPATGVFADPQPDSAKLMFSAQPLDAKQTVLTRNKPSRARFEGLKSTIVMPPEWLTAPRSAEFHRNWTSIDPGKPGRDFARPDRPAKPRDQVTIGKSVLGFTTEKQVGLPNFLKPADCVNDDECAEYSSLPRARQPKPGLMNVRKPYFGLSLKTPIQ